MEGKNKEQFTIEVLSIQEEIITLKNSIDKTEKQPEMEAVEQKISILQKEIQNSTNLSWEEKGEILSSLNAVFGELTGLKREILGDDAEKEEIKEKKSFWDKTKDMWNEWWETRAKMRLSVAGVAAGVYSIVKLFKGRSKEKKKEHKKKSWLGRAWGNIKRYGWIALGAVGGFLGIKWLVDKYGEKTPSNRDTPEDQVGNYEKLSEKQKFPYEQLWSATDIYYETIFEKELYNSETGKYDNWEDDAAMDSLSQQFGKDKTLKGVVPWCMNNSFKSVSSVLSEKGIEIDFLQQSAKEISIWLKSKISTPIGESLLKFLWCLPSWTPGKQSARDYIESWIEKKPQERRMQLKAFFRQQCRVTVFLKAKQGDLIKKIAEKKFQSDPSEFEDRAEAMENTEWFKRNIEDDLDYQSFHSGGIANASWILSRYNILYGDIDKSIMDLVNDCDEKREEILYEDENWNDVLSRAKSDLEKWTLSGENREKLRKSCKNIQKDIVELEKIAEEDALDMYARLGNTANVNKQDLLKHWSILPLLQAVRTDWFNQIDAKIASWEFSMDDYQALKQVINNYFALKKELLVWAQTYQLIKHDDGSLWIRIGNFALDCFKNMGIGIGKMVGGDGFWNGLGRFATGALPIALVGAGITYAVHHPRRTLKFVITSPVAVPMAIYNHVGLRTTRFVSWKYYGHAGSLRRTFFAESDWPAKLVRALKEGRISLDKAKAIIDGSQGKLIRGSIKTKWNGLYSANADVGKRILLRKVFEWNTLWGDADWGLLAKYFDYKAINKRLVGNSTDDIVKVVNDLKYCENITMNVKNRKVFELIIDRAKLSSTDLKLLVGNIAQVDIAQLSEKELNNLAKQLSKKGNWSAFADVDQLKGIVDGVRREVSTVEHLLPNHSIVNTLNKDLKSLEDEAGMLVKAWKSKTVRYQLIEQDIKYIDMFKKELKNIPSNQLDELEILWKEIRALHTNESVATMFLKDVKTIIDHPNFVKIADKFDRKDLRKFKSDLSLSDEVIESVSKLVKQVENKGLVKLMANGWKGLKQGFKTLVNVLRKVHIR